MDEGTGGKVRAAIYARISMDAAGEELGVTRQLDMARDLIASRGWVEVEAYADNSISALSGKHRPAYSALCEAIARGEVDRVVIYHLSRLWRNRTERTRGIETFQHARVSIASVRGPELDMQSAYGRSIADLLGVFDTMESEVKGERVRDHRRQRAEAGLHSGGGVRPYGYRRIYDRAAINEATGKRQTRRVVRVEVDPDEAEIVRELRDRLLAGESLRAMAADLNARDVPTSTGKRWASQTVVQVMRAARISGRIESGREILTGDDGAPVPVSWDAIISAEDSDKLRRLLVTPERRTSPVVARKTMLTGILVCARCDRPMVSRPRQGVPRYVCNADRGGCGHMNTDGAKTDKTVAIKVLRRLRSPQMAQRLQRRSGADPDVIDRVRADEERLEQLTVDYHDPEMGMARAEYVAARKAIMARLEEGRNRLTATSRDDAAATFLGKAEQSRSRTGRTLGEEMKAQWESMTDAQRRPVVASTVERIVVDTPQVRGRFDAERLDLQWIDAAEGQ